MRTRTVRVPRRSTWVLTSALGAAVCASMALAPFASAQTNGAMAWGLDRYGELGVGTTEIESEFGGPFDLSFYPIAVDALAGVSAISPGQEQTVDVLEDGTVQDFGDNDNGQLGIGRSSGPERCRQPAGEVDACSTLPVQVPGLTGVRQVASGGAHNLALLEDGTVMAWGDNEDGQLGAPSSGPQKCDVPSFADPKHGCSRAPVPVAGLSGVKAIAAGSDDSFALLENGTVEAWGEDEFGELGVAGEFLTTCAGGFQRCQPTPTLVRTASGEVLKGVTAIAAGAQHTLALLENGTVVGWGLDTVGEVGDGGQEAKYSAVPVVGLSGVRELGAGYGTSAALLSNGTVETWGTNLTGELGVGTDTGPERCSLQAPEIPCSTIPVAVGGLTGVKQIGVGSEDDVVLLEDGTVMTWGDNNAGGLGTQPLGPEKCRVEHEDSGERCSTLPVAVGGLADVSAIAVSSGDNDSFAFGPLRPSVSGVEGEEEAPEASGAAQMHRARLEAAESGARASGSELGGTLARITGSDLSGATAVLFGGRPAESFTVEKLSRVSAVSPPGKGTVDITVVTPRGESEVNGRDRFAYTPAETPTVTVVSPAEGFEAGGASVTITGTNLDGATAVSFGDVPATSFTVNATGTITAVAPAGTGTVDIRVLTPSGESTANAHDRFTYLPPAAPTVTKLSPTKGSTAGGTVVTISGTHFVEVQTVDFGNAEAAYVTVNSSGSIAAAAPPGTAGAVEVHVTTTAGRSPASKRDIFKYAARR